MLGAVLKIIHCSGMHYCKPREVRENLPQEAQVARFQGSTSLYAGEVQVEGLGNLVGESQDQPQNWKRKRK